MCVCVCVQDAPREVEMVSMMEDGERGGSDGGGSGGGGGEGDDSSPDPLTEVRWIYSSREATKKSARRCV